MISIKLFIFSILFDSIFCWTPIGSIHNLNQITPIKIADKEYVVWKPDSNKDDFVVQDILTRMSFDFLLAETKIMISILHS